MHHDNDFLKYYFAGYNKNKTKHFGTSHSLTAKRKKRCKPVHLGLTLQDRAKRTVPMMTT